MPAATQRSIICPPRQRFTFRFTWRVRLSRLSAALVVASERCRRADRCRVITVSVSSSPSRTLPAALGCSCSKRVASAVSRRVAVVDVGGLIGAAHDRLRGGALPLRQVVENVPELVDLAALDQRRLAEDHPHRFVQRARPVENHQQTPIGAEAASL